jgi:hypothetical protein
MQIDVKRQTVDVTKTVTVKEPDGVWMTLRLTEQETRTLTRLLYYFDTVPKFLMDSARCTPAQAQEYRNLMQGLYNKL